jgi:L-fuconolactonase
VKIDAHQHFWRYRPEESPWIGAFGENPRFKGVRHLVHDEADDRFMLDRAFLRGVAALAGRGARRSYGLRP